MDRNSVKAAFPLETREYGRKKRERRKRRCRTEGESRTFGRKAARIRSPAHMNVHPTCNYIGLRVEFPMRSVSGFVQVWPTHGFGPGRVIPGAHIAGFTGRLSNQGFPLADLSFYFFRRPPLLRLFDMVATGTSCLVVLHEFFCGFLGI